MFPPENHKSDAASKSMEADATTADESVEPIEKMSALLPISIDAVESVKQKNDATFEEIRVDDLKKEDLFKTILEEKKSDAVAITEELKKKEGTFTF